MRPPKKERETILLKIGAVYVSHAPTCKVFVIYVRDKNLACGGATSKVFKIAYRLKNNNNKNKENRVSS